jgi:hypothetical protein
MTGRTLRGWSALGAWLVLDFHKGLWKKDLWRFVDAERCDEEEEGAA